MGTLADVKTRVRTLLEDPIADFATDGYITPMVNQVYEEAVGMLEDVSANPFLTEQREQPNVPAGTTSLADYADQGQQWEALQNPLSLWVKNVGAPVEQYTMVKQTDQLPFTSPLSNLQAGTGLLGAGTVGHWEYRSDIIFVTPFASDVDLMLRGEFRPPALVEDTDRVRIHYEMTAFLSYATVALVGAVRENPTWAAFEGRAELVLDRIASKLTKEQQSGIFRFKRSARRRRSYL